MSGLRKAVLFDMDGVLVLTESIKAEAHVATVEKLGGKASLELYTTMLGQSHENIRSAYLRAAGLRTDPQEYTRAYRAIYHALLDKKLAARPGAKELVEGLRRQGFRLAVVSSSAASSVRKILEAIGLQDAFDVRVTSDDTRQRKPDPAPYILALSRLGLPASAAVILEDSATGIIAAVRAQIPVIAVRHAFNQGEAFDDARAILDSFEDTGAAIALVRSILTSEDQEHGNHQTNR